MSLTEVNATLKALESAFKKQGDKAIAVGMENYLRNQFPCYGIKSDLRRETTRPYQQILLKHGPDYIEKIVRDCWSKKEREFHYVGMEYLAKTAKHWKGTELPLLEYLVLHHSWWDTVDTIASNIVGPYFRKFPEQIAPAIKRWNAQDNFWLHRVSIIFQLKYGAKTDEKLLFAQCRRFAGEKEFFIRKGIGWALRQYSKYNAESVRKFISETKLQPLSLKEASKYV